MNVGTSLWLVAQATQPADSSSIAAASSGLGFWLFLLAAMALAPFVLTMVTSFAKLVIVGGILRHALGTQQIPPNTVITGLALILTVHIMSPVAAKMYTNYESTSAAIPAGEKPTTAQLIRNITTSVEGPLRSFLEQHSRPDNVALFEDLRDRLSHARGIEGPDLNSTIKDPLAKQLLADVTLLAPAFMLSQLTEAFQIGFLLFVPFLVIDLVVSNVLMAMGMQMLSPATVSMPLKLLLFVLIDGWKLIMRGLVLSYV